MKRIFYVPALILLLLVGCFTITSCGNAAKKTTNSGGSNGTANAQQTYQQKVHHFDSVWNETLQMVNVRITQWDSSAKTYRGPIRHDMDEKIGLAKKQRDSLQALLGQVSSQAQEQWNAFELSVRDQYADVVGTLKGLSGLNQ